MQCLIDKIEIEAKGATNTFSPLTKSPITEVIMAETSLPKSNFKRKIPFIVGQVFNRLTCIEETEPREHRRRGMFRCECGNIKNIAFADVRSGHTQSCGCFHTERIRSARSHGGTVGGEAPEYLAWKAMKQRCTQKSAAGWMNYGGRGIVVCERWVNSFPNFLEDVGLRPDKRYSLDRINNDGNYEPGNVRWATRSQQRRNSRGLHHPVTFDGKTRLIADWSKVTGVPAESIGSRLRHGWSVERALFTPIGGTWKVNAAQVRVMMHARKSGATYSDLAVIFNISPEYVSQLVRNGKKPAFGGHSLEKRRRGEAERGCWEYRLVI